MSQEIPQNWRKIARNYYKELREITKDAVSEEISVSFSIREMSTRKLGYCSLKVFKNFERELVSQKITISINKYWFERFFGIDPKEATLILKFVIGHELGHAVNFSSGEIEWNWMGASESEFIADDYAKLLTGITRKQFLDAEKRIAKKSNLILLK